MTVTHQITQSSIIINSHTFYIILYYNSFFNTIPISMSPYSSLVSILNNDLSGTFSIINTLNPSQMINIHNIHTRFFFFTENTEYMYMYICCCIGYIYVYLLSPADIHPRHQNTVQGTTLPSSVLTGLWPASMST